jgi:hypothetical protein
MSSTNAHILKNEGTAMLPIYVKNRDFREPRDPVYLLVAGNGTFLVKKMGLYSASVRPDGSVLGLLNHTEDLTREFGRVPYSLMCRVLGFFRAAFCQHGGEAIVFLYYSKDTRSFCIKVPPQQIYSSAATGSKDSTSHVVYESCERPPQYVKLGTVHSHAGFPAFHSFIDDRDEEHEDGLHITIGEVDRARPDVSVSFVVNGRRFMLHPDDVLAGHERYAPLLPPDSWLSKISCVPGPGRKDGSQKKPETRHAQPPHDDDRW